jgi:hypothetical protein
MQTLAQLDGHIRPSKYRSGMLSGEPIRKCN